MPKIVDYATLKEEVTWLQKWIIAGPGLCLGWFLHANVGVVIGLPS